MAKRKAINEGGTMDAFLVKKGKSDNDVANKLQGEWQEVEEHMFIFNPEGLEHRAKIVSFDIDGTIITTKSGKTFAVNECDWQFFSPTVPSVIEEYYKNGYKAVFFTNQKGIQTGKQDPAAFKRKVEAICRKIPVPVQVFVSLGTLKYRKPCIGMWEYMELKENGNTQVDRAASIYVGDAAGRTVSDKRKKKDHSAADRLFSMNIGTEFFTPEQFFLKQNAVEPFVLPSFNPARFLNERRNLFEPPDTPLPGAKKEVIVLVGYPGCGKSTLAAKLEKEYGYGVVNRDTEKTWQKCVQVAKLFLKKGKSVVIDNTNGDVESRKRYCDVARTERVDCRCFLFTCDFDQASHHCKYRIIVGTDSLHQEVGGMVLRMFKSKFQEPKLNEGFSSIVKVNFVPEFEKKEHEDVYRMYLCES